MGDRAPDAVLTRPSGEPVRLFDLLAGPHFTAIAYGPRAGRELASLEWPSRGATLRRVVVTDTAGDGEDSFADSSGTFRRAYGVHADTLLVVRPDGYLAQLASSEMMLRARAAIAPLAPSVLP